MIERVVPLNFIKPTIAGRTLPSILTCERANRSTVDVVAKFSAGCFSLGYLLIEVVSACLARDLGLPVPEPVLIDVSDEWIATVPDQGRRDVIQKSERLAFGSCLASAGYNTWSIGNRLTKAMVPTAFDIFVFDAIIQNPDRSSENPNCLIRGDDLLIIDHELAFSHDKVLFWRPPWSRGGLEALKMPGKHIFRELLSNEACDDSATVARWQALSAANLQSYLAALPPEWGAAMKDATKAVTLLQDVLSNLDGCFTEVKRVLQ